MVLFMMSVKQHDKILHTVWTFKLIIPEIVVEIQGKSFWHIKTFKSILYEFDDPDKKFIQNVWIFFLGFLTLKYRILEIYQLEIE